MAKNWTPHVLIAWGGTLGNPGVDVWTNTLRAIVARDAAQGGNISIEEQEAFAAAFKAPLTTFHTTASFIGSGATLDWVKVNMIADTGKYLYPTTTVLDFTPVPGASSVGTGFDWRRSLAITTRTNYQRGRAHAGRWYPPNVALGTTSGGVSPYLTTASAQAVADAAATLLTALATVGADGTGFPDGPVQLMPAVVAPGATDVGLPPVFNYIQSVEVDRVTDTQRRRTNRVPRNVVTAQIA